MGERRTDPVDHLYHLQKSLVWAAIPDRVMMCNPVPKIDASLDAVPDSRPMPVLAGAPIEALRCSWPQRNTRPASMLVGAIAKSKPESERQLLHQVARCLSAWTKPGNRLLDLLVLPFFQEPGVQPAPYAATRHRPPL